MEVCQFEVVELTEEDGGRGWVRADRVMERGFAKAAKAQIAEQLADGRDEGVVKHDDRLYRWRWTESAAARRRAEARAELARQFRAAEDEAEFLGGDGAAALAAAAGYGRMRARELAEVLKAG